MDNEGIIFGAEFDPSEIVKGVDAMTNAFKRAQEQGNVSNVTLEKMQGAIEGATAAVEDMQKVTGKPLMAGLNDGKIVQQLGNIKDGFKEMELQVDKTVIGARGKMAELTAASQKYKASVLEINTALKQNQASIDNANAKLKSLSAQESNAAEKAAVLYKEIRLLNAENATLRQSLTNTEKSFQQTTAQIKLQSEAVSTSERGAQRLKTAMSNITDGNTIAAREISGVTRRILSIGSIFAFTAIISGVTAVIDIFKEFIDSMDKVSEAEKLLKANQANLNDIFEQGDKAAGNQLANAKILYEASQDTNLSIKERKDAIAELKKEFPDYFADISTETILNGGAKDSYDQLTESIIANARAKAARDKIGELESQKLDIEFSKQKVRNATDQEAANIKKINKQPDQNRGFLNTTTVVSEDDQLGFIADRRTKALIKLNSEQDFLQAQEDFLENYIGLGALAKGVIATDHKKTPKAKKEIENIYEQELLKLKEDLAKLDEKGFTDEASINKAIEAQFKIRSAAYVKAFKEGKLTAPQLESLQGNLSNLEKLTISKADADFAEKRKAYLDKVAADLQSLQDAEALKRIANIQDDFERQKQAIEFGGQKEVDALNRSRAAKIAELKKNADANGVPAELVQKQIDDINNAVDKIIEDTQVHTTQMLQQLAFNTFEKASEKAKQFLDYKNLNISEQSLTDITKAATLYTEGKLSYEAYQKELTRIARAEGEKRYEADKKFLEDEIKFKTTQILTNHTLTDDQIQRLEAEITALRQRLTDATKGHIEGDIANKKADDDRQIAAINKYAAAIESVVASIISFWQQANEAEQKALERSIAIQQRRVDEARNVAAKGNAEYLRMEEDRQKQLIIKQENAARRQIAINAALQASQLLVAITGAIAKIAEPGVGAADVIASIGIIVGSLAAGYGIVKSLQNEQPSFFVGTEDTGPGGDVDGRGGFHAILHPNERVLTKDQNQKLKGLTNEELVNTVEQSRRFVNENYATMPPPSLNLAALDMANNIANTKDIKIAALMEERIRQGDENNILQKKTLRAINELSIIFNIDQRGLYLGIQKLRDDDERSKNC